MKLGFELDEWQKEVLEAEGDLCICSGRQVGKSSIVAIKAAEYAAAHRKKNILVVSVTEEQAVLMLQKIMAHLRDNYSGLIASGHRRPTKHKVELNNDSVIMTKAVGQYGLGILGLTIDIFIADEAAFMPEAIWDAATPMLLTTGGQKWLLSTPNTKSGFFFRAFTNPDYGFKTFHVKSEDVALKRPEPQRSIMIAYLEQEKQRMSNLQYSQWYKAQFMEESGQLFSDKLIRECQTGDTSSSNVSSHVVPREYYLGIDVARMGGDETVYTVFQKRADTLYQIENLVNKYNKTTDVIDKIIWLQERYNFRKIYIDSGGIGAGIYDELQRETFGRNVIPVNNARKSISKESDRTRQILKVDLYMNLLRLMERGKVKLLKDHNIYMSLRSIIKEENPNTHKILIYGRYDHIAEAIVRACFCMQKIPLNIFVDWIK